jgi:hypothetical protein
MMASPNPGVVYCEFSNLRIACSVLYCVLGWVNSSDRADRLGCIIRCILHVEIGMCRCLFIFIAKWVDLEVNQWPMKIAMVRALV